MTEGFPPQFLKIKHAFKNVSSLFYIKLYKAVHPNPDMTTPGHRVAVLSDLFQRFLVSGLFYNKGATPKVPKIIINTTKSHPYDNIAAAKLFKMVKAT